MADTNVWIAAAIGPRGNCGRLLTAALDRRWQPIVSPLLVTELQEVLARRKFRRWLSIGEAHQFVCDIQALSVQLPDPPALPHRISADPDDEFLIALARAANVDALISGDHHLTDLTNLEPPVMTPSAFLTLLGCDH